MQETEVELISADTGFQNMTRKIREFNKYLREKAIRATEGVSGTSFPERRYGPKDRRKSHTFIMNDRRSGIADRRRRSKENTKQ